MTIPKPDITIKPEEVYFSIRFEGQRLTTVISKDEWHEGVCTLGSGLFLMLAKSLIEAHLSKGLGWCLPL